MKLLYNELDNGIRVIKLSGKLDMTATYDIEVEFVRYCAGENARILVDLSNMNYISSIGIPMLVNTAKSLSSRKGKMVLLNPQKNVTDVLKIAGIHLIIPIHHDLEEALASLLA